MTIIGQGRRELVRAGQGGEGASASIDYNILWVVLDDIGTEWVDWLDVGETYSTDPNFEYAHTPFLSSMAAAGLVFTDFNAAHLCGPMRAMMNTGQYPYRTGFTRNIRSPQDNSTATMPLGYVLQTNGQFLAGWLKAQRPTYQFGHFGKWHISDAWSTQLASEPTSLTPPDANLNHYALCGYDHQDANINNIGGAAKWWRVVNGVATTFYDGTDPDETQNNTAIHAASAIAWIAAKGETPWVAYVCFGAPHLPWIVPPSTMISAATQTELTTAGLAVGAEVTGTYGDPNVPLLFRASMESVDTAVQRVWNSLTPAVKARTMLFVVGDNGTVPQALPTGFRNSKGSCFWGGVRAPGIVVGPLVGSPGRTSTAMCQGVDLFPTFCDILRVRMPTDETYDGLSILPLIKNSVPNTKNAIHDYLYFHRVLPPSSEVWAAYDGRYRAGPLFSLIVNVTDELTDPLETVSVHTTQAAKGAELQAWKNSIGSPALP